MLYPINRRFCFGDALLRGDLLRKFVLSVSKMLSQTRPRHLTFFQGHDALVGLRIAVHPLLAGGVEPGGQFLDAFIMAIGLDPFPQFQIFLSTQDPSSALRAFHSQKEIAPFGSSYLKISARKAIYNRQS